jgi:hypothetical protein
MTLGALLLGAAALAAPAQAQTQCGAAPGVVQSSYPADGATAVPTNAPLYLYGPELKAGTTEVTLEDASGEAASIDVQATPGGLLVDAFLGLDPSTTYELTVAAAAGGEDWSASFTTGAGPATRAQLRAPDVSVSIIEQERGSCGLVSAICVIGSVSASRTLEVLLGNEVLSLGGGQPAPAYAANSGPIAANGCIEVRVREPGGSASASTKLCGDELGRFDLAASAPAPTSCQPYAPASADGSDDSDSSSSDSGGCAMGASGAASGAGALVFGLSVLLLARTRRSRRTLIVGCR